MDSPELFIAFGVVMLVVALLGVAVDWFGKPLKHRRFVAKAYRYPDERQPRRSQVRSTDWSDAPFVMPVIESPADRQPLRYPDPLTAGALDAAEAAAAVSGAPTPAGDVGPPTEMVPVADLGVDEPTSFVFEPDLDAAPPEVGSDDRIDPVIVSPGTDDVFPQIVTLEETDPEAADLVALEPTDAGQSTPAGAEATVDVEPADGEDAVAPAADPAGRARGWHPGQYVFNLTPDGREPSATTVRTRYWKNVADTGGAGIFGEDNVARMAEGRPPRRFNHRTGKHESMSLPTSGYDASAGQTPVPAWPASELDPFA